MEDDAGYELVVFTEALKLQPRDRAQFLQKACGEDVELRRKVEALVRAYERIGDFLEEPPNEGASL